MSLTEQLKKTPVRLGVFYLGLFIIAVALGMTLASYLVNRDLNSRLDRMVVEEYSLISSQYQSGNPSTLVAVLKSRIGFAKDLRDIYQLRDRDGKLIISNTSVKLTVTGLNRIHASNLDISEDVHYSILGGQVGSMSLWVGRSNEETNQIKSLLLEATAAMILVATSLVVAGTLILTNRFQSRLNTTRSLLYAVSQGKLDLRLPITDRSDDIDSISISVNKMLDELQATIAALDESSTNIAHDLRAPISRIFMDLDDALRKAERGDNVILELESAQNELGGITRTFDSLLRIARVEKRTRKNQFHKIDLSALLADLHDSYMPVAEAKSMHLLLEIQQSDSLNVIGDEGLLNQLIINLIENAFRYCPSGTTIRLGLRQVQNHAELRIADDGTGIPEDEREKVFQRLYRVERSRQVPGSGLGLSLVRAIATLHDGTVTLADAQPGLVVVLSASRPITAQQIRWLNDCMI